MHSYSLPVLPFLYLHNCGTFAPINVDLGIVVYFSLFMLLKFHDLIIAVIVLIWLAFNSQKFALAILSNYFFYEKSAFSTFNLSMMFVSNSPRNSLSHVPVKIKQETRRCYLRNLIARWKTTEKSINRRADID